MSRIYVASSWRNPYQPMVVDALRAVGHDVYDFRNPPGKTGFAWSQIDPHWEQWSAKSYRFALEDPVAEAGFAADFEGMSSADVCVLVLPSGRSAHLEAGFMAGQGKRVFILTRDGEEPELMAKLCTKVCVSLAEVIEAVQA